MHVCYNRIAFFLLAGLLATGVHVRQQDLPVKFLITADGLPSSTRFAVVQDHLGFLWIRAASVHLVSMLWSDTQSVVHATESAVPLQREEAVIQEEAQRQLTYWIRVQMAFTGLTLAFGLLHLILFLFSPKLRSNLYFALFVLSYAVAIFFDFQHLIDYNVLELRLHRVAMTINLIFALRFFYELFLPKPPRQFLLIAAGLVLAGLLATFEPIDNFKYLLIMSVVSWTEILRVEVQAIRGKHDGAWIIVAGFGALLLFGLYDLLLDVNLMGAVFGIENGYQFGLVGLFLATSVYLARDMARTNDQVIEQERLARVQETERLRLEAENTHKALELQKAKELEASYHKLEEAHQRLKATQVQLIQSEKMASLGQLTAGIAHEIKNPLNFINNFAEVNEELADEMREAYEANPEIKLEDLIDVLTDLKQNAQVIAHHGKRADGIIHAMMQHASGGTGQRETVDINQLVSEHIDLAYHGKRAQVQDLKVEIERDLDEEAGVVKIVPQEIGRVLLNLLGNAFDAVHEHAAKVDGEYAPTITVSTRQVEGRVEIRVKDNGPGIPAEIKDKIFEPFFTTKPTGTGTGLGLSLSYDIVTQGHGGTLMVESTEGEGATFVITLPNSLS